MYIRREGVANLHKYAYAGTDKSLVSRYILKPWWWSQLVKAMPKSVAPNMITLTGLMFVLVNVMQMLYYAPDLYAECPHWVYYTWAVGLFMYQSFDSIDGMQARRTGTSGPLGEMFDHGVDAINTSLGVMLTSAAIRLGTTWLPLICQFATLANFYLSTWEEYHTGTLYLSYFSGPVEGILIVVAIFTISGAYGPQIWERDLYDMLGVGEYARAYLPALARSLPLNHAFLVFGAVALAANTLAASGNVYRARKSKGLPLIPALLGLAPYFGMAGLVAVWLIRTPSLVYDHLLLTMLYIGITFAYSVGLMITAHVTRMPFPMWNVLNLPIAYGVVDSFLPSFGIPSVIGQYGFAYMSACLGFATGVYGSFVFDVVYTITEEYDIWCLFIKHPKKD